MKKSNKRKPLISALEPRILFDGAALTTAVDVLDNNSYDTNTSTQDSVAKNDATSNTEEAPAVQSFERDRKEIAFVDTNVEDYQTLVDGIDSNTDVYLVESFNDISNILENLNDIDSIHILSHGSTGEITIGNDILNQDTLSSYEEVLNSIKTSLNDSGDILLYGCNVGADGEGENFIDALAEKTDADIAASDDITGNSALNGDWDLEYKSGIIETNTFVVNDYTQTLDNDANGNFNFSGIGRGSAGTSKYLDANLAGSGTGTLKIVANDVDYAQGERNAVYFKDANDSRETFLGYLRGSNGVDSTTTFNNVSFNTSGTATIRIYGEVSGWVYDIKSANFTTSGNAAPEFTSSTSASVAEDSSVNITVSGKDGGVLNDNVTLSLYSGPSYGTISGFSTKSGSTTASDTFTYTPNADYNGNDSITFKLYDGIDTVYQTINISVSSVSDIVSDSITGNEDNSITYNLLTNDTFESTDRISSVTQGSQGNVTIVNASTGEVKYTPRTEHWNGTDSFNYTVYSGGKYETTTVNVTVNPVNDAPVISDSAAIKLQNINEDVVSADNKGSLIDSLFDPIFNDVDTGDSLSSVEVVSINSNASNEGVYEYSTDNGSTWALISNGNILDDKDKIRFNPVSNYFGDPGTITLKVRDQGNGIGGVQTSTNTVTLSVEVNSVNDIPVITSDAGAATITETAADDVPGNLTPTNTVGSTATVGMLSGTLAGTDVEDDLSSTALNFSIQGGTLASTIYTLQGKYGLLTLNTTSKEWRYEANRQEALNALAVGDTDTDKFVLKIIDSDGAQANQDLIITLVGENDLPEVSQPIPDQTFSGSGDWIYQIPSNTFTDREGNGLTYTVEIVDNNAGDNPTFTLPAGVTFDEATRRFIGDKDSIQNGDYYFKVTATDSASAIVSDIFQVTFTDVENSAPVVANPIDRVAIASGTSGTIYTVQIDELSKMFSDDIDNSSALSYSVGTLPTGMTFDSSTREFKSDGTLVAGKHIIDLTATDTGGKATTTQFAIYVDDGTNSTISADQTIPNQTWDGSGEHSFKIPSNAFTFDDVGDTVSYSAKLSDDSALPTWLTLDAATGVLSGNPPHDAAATYGIAITATESGQSSKIDSTFTLNVTNPNDAPIVNGTVVAADQLIQEGDTSFSYNFGELFTDADGSNLTYTAQVWDSSTSAWITLPTWLTIDSTNRTISGTPIGNVPFLDIRLLATDEGGATNETTFKLDLQDPASTASVGAYTSNDSGVVSVTGTPTEGQILTVDSITDPNGDPSTATYQWQVSSDNGTTWTDISNGTNANYTLTNNEANKQVRAKVFYTDGGGVAEVQESDAKSIANVDDPGSVNLSGSMASGNVVVATIADSDGLVGVEPTYAWYRSTNTNDNNGPWTQITGATGSSYTLTNADGNRYIKVIASYTDNQNTSNTPEGISSATVQLGAVAPIAINDTDTINESGGLNNATAGEGTISGNLFTNDTDENESDTKTLVEVRVGATEGQGEGITTGTSIDSNTIYTITGNYGTLTINEADGAYTYTIDEDNNDVEALNISDTLTESFNYTIKDSTNKNDIAVLNITINGANDDLIMTTDKNSTDLIEAGGVDNTTVNTSAASIIFTAIDVDNDESFDVAYLTDQREDVLDRNTGNTTSEQVWFQQGTTAIYSRTTQYGGVTFDTETGKLEYYISNNIPEIEALQVGDSETDSISIKVKSGTQEIVKSVDFVIKGTNDTPDIQIVDVEGSILEGTTLNDSGSITFTDVDLADRPIATEVTKSVNAKAQNGRDALVLTSTQQADIEEAFSITNIGTNTNDGTVNWDYTIAEDKLDFLGKGEVVTAIFTITVTDDENAIDTQDVTITITGTNDNPEVDISSELYIEIGFGEELEPNNLKEHFSFSDKDLSDKFTFEIRNNPRGLEIDENTGILLGRPVQSGKFVVTVIGTDDEGAYIEKDFNMLVIAPPEAAKVADETPPSTNEIAQEVKREIEFETSDDIVSNEVIQDNLETSIEGNSDTSNTELTSLVSNTDGNPNDKVIQANANVNVSNDGEVNFADESNEAFQTVGLTIETLEIKQDELEIKIIDTRVGQKYSVTLQDGTALPSSLNFDPNTGIIKGALPAGMEELAISIKALSSDGTTRILNLKIDVNELKEKEVEEVKEEAKYETLKEQIQAQNHKINGYGDYVSSLFNNSSIA